jgi:hypothetical protein
MLLDVANEEQLTRLARTLPHWMLSAEREFSPVSSGLTPPV